MSMYLVGLLALHDLLHGPQQLDEAVARQADHRKRCDGIHRCAAAYYTKQICYERTLYSRR